MPRTCFVIMPFSSTASCTREEWTEIFNHVFKPAVEGSGLDYECKRSEADRGNVVAAIMRDLYDSYVVIADLTDRNANVFYELGVRHSISHRTILLAQKREDIPFDLQGYGSHVYSWKTQKGREELAQRIRKLFLEIDENPERSDSPVSDYLEDYDKDYLEYQAYKLMKRANEQARRFRERTAQQAETSRESMNDQEADR